MKKILLSQTLCLFVAISICFTTKSNAQSIEAGDYFTLMLCTGNSTPKAVGDNGNGQLGDGTYSQQTNPVLVNGIANVIAVSGGGYHSLALKSDSTVWAWGANWDGQLGDGTTTDRITPVQVSGLTGIIAISAGEYHSLALKSDGTVWAWGYNWYGQLGDGTNTDITTPVQVSGLTGITDISAGRYHSLARKNNGTVWAWGYNAYGQLGDGTTTNRNTPVQTLTISGITSVAGGRYHSLARKSNGTIWSWGYNGYGQLGDGTTIQRTSPVQVNGLTGMTNVAAGSYHSLAIKSDGTAWAWGNNGDGELGDATYSNNSSPVQVSGLTDVTVISGGYYHSVAVKSNGTFWAWGANWNGQLGDGTSNSTNVPVQIHDCCSNLPAIALSDTCLKMDTTVIGGNSQKTFLIFNSACDTLKVTNITINNAVFAVSPSSGSIPRYSSAIFTVTFSPVALGNSSGTITIHNNAKDTTVCLSGYCVPAPTMTHTPSLFNISLGCNDSSTSVLNIGNTGAGILNYNITTTASSTGANFYDGFESGNISTWNVGSGIYTRTVVTTNPASGTYCLQLNSTSVSSYDGVNHTFPSSTASYISFKIKSGGGGSSSCSVEIGRASDIISNGSLAQIWMDNGALQLYMWSPSTGSIPTPMVIGQWYQVEFRNINYSTKTFDYYVNNSLVASGVSFWNSSINSVDVIHFYSWNSNSISYFDDIVISSDPNRWLSYLPTAGTVNSSGSQNVNVKFNSANIVAGTYYGNLILNSNDPAHLQVAVPCTLSVTGSPKIALNKTCLNYGSLMVGATTKDSVMVTNTGCDTLKASSIVSSSSVFTVNPASGNLLPGQSGYIKVTFTPVAVTSYSATLTFHGNVNDTTVCLTGTGLPAPTISTNPASFSVTINGCNDSVTSPLTINNTGAADLNFTISNFNTTPVPTCTVTTVYTCCNYGINNVQFNTINNSSSNASAGYQDFTSINTLVKSNKTYQLSVQTGYSWEYVNAWVDWNNNGIFESGENVMNNISGSQTHSTSVTVPANAVQNTSLRMRVVSSDNYNPQACADVYYGQHEDYSVVVDNWLSAAPLTGTVTPGGSTVVNVKSKSAGLGSGQYTSSIAISSNDPANPMVTVPCTLTVVGSPKINVSPTCLQFDSTMTSAANSIPHSVSIISESMASTPVTGTIKDIAAWNASGYMLLTPASYGVNGEFEYNQSLPQNFDVNFDFYTGGGNGADAVYFYYGCSSTPTNEDANVGGYIIAFDEYSGDNAPIQLRYQGSILANTTGAATFGNAAWHHAKISVSGNVFSIYLDNVLALSYTDISRSLAGNLCGWGARTGGLHNEHRVKNVMVTQVPSLYVKNTGCDTLRISNIAKQTVNFTLTPNSGNVAPGDSVHVTVTFTPQVTGTLLDTLTILNNDVTKKVCLSGIAYPKPTIAVNSASFSATLACVDSLRDSLFINNTGGSNLNYNINILNATMSSSLPIATSCSPPGSQNTCCNMGIVNVTLNSINNTTSISDGEYQDYTASQKTILVPGQTYTLSVQSGSSYNEYAEAWIDYNNNGTFESGENVMNNLNSLPNTIHTATFTVPFSAVKNKSVRMRVVSDYYWDGVPQPCNNVYYGQFEDYTIQLLGWVALSSASGTVVPGSSDTVAVTFNSKGLNVGTYTASISIDNNDPLNNPRNISATLNVTGAGKIALSKNCLYLDSIMQYTAHTDSLYIKNTGCDTLRITNITETTNIFSVNATTFKIATGDSAKLRITYYPISYPGPFYDTLTILNNDVTQKVCLSGKSFQAPIISTVPTSLSYTLACCDSIINSTVTIHNTGGSKLTCQVGGSQNFSEGFENGLSNWVKSSGSSWTVVPDPYSGSYSLKESPSGNYFNSMNEYIQFARKLKVSDKTNCTLSFWEKGQFETCCDNYTVQGSINGGPFNTFVTLNGNVHGWTQHIFSLTPYVNNGDSISLRFNFASDGSVTYAGINMDDIVVTGMNSFPTWLKNTSASSDTIAPGNSAIANLKFKSCGLTVGTYTYNIAITSNDPLKPMDTIPAILHVIGAGKIALSKTSLYLDSIMQYTTSRDSFYIKNTGCDTLKLTSITTQTSTYSVTPAFGNILLGDSAKIYVTFAPTSYPGPFYDTLTILNNDVTKKVCLSGKAFQRPIISIVPTSFSYTLTCCDSTTVPLKIHNTGGSDLDYNISIVYSQPIAASCTPSMTDYNNYWNCTGGDHMGIYNITFNNINNTTGICDGDYHDYSSTQKTVAMQGQTYTLSVQTGTNYWEYVSAWIDWNNNGIFENGEQVMNNVYAYINHTSNVIIPANAIQGTALRMRVRSDYVSVNDPCNTLDYGQTEDYAVIVSGWLALSPTSGTVTSGGGADTVLVKFKSCALTIGTYTTNIIIASNDPLKPIDTIPVTLNVVGTSHIALSKTCVNFDTIMQFTNKFDTTLVVSNTGCDTLFLSAKTSQYFWLDSLGKDSANDYLLPGASKNVTLLFAPTTTGTITGTFTIHRRNLSDTVVCLNGYSYPPPVQCHTPNSFNVHFTICQDSITDTLRVCNTGGSNLNYSLWSPDGRSTSFNGSNAYIRVSNNYSGLTTVTLEAWINPSNVTGLKWIMSNSRDCCGPYGGFGLYLNGSTLSGYLYLNSNSSEIGASSVSGLITPNTWQHVAMVYDGTKIQLYRNGVLVATSSLNPYSAILNGPYNLCVGVLAFAAPTYYPFAGNIDEVRIWNIARSQTEIASSMGKLLGNESGLQGYWNFDNGTASDVTANGNNGTLNGGATITIPNAQLIPAATGTVALATTNTLQVKFKKAGLSYGTHIFPIYLNSNDPLNPLDTINVSMIIDSLSPASPVAKDTNVCFGNPTPPLISTANPGDTIRWYDNATLTSLVYTGNSFVSTQTVIGTYTYYVTSTDSISGCVSLSDTVLLHINAAPGKPTATDAAACFGSAIPNLSSTGTLLKWYSNSALTALVHTGNPFNTGQTAVGTYTYYVADSTGGCPKSISDTAMLTIHPLPSKPIANDTAACFGGTIPSLVANVTGNDTIKWYDAGMVFIHKGSPFNTGQTSAGTYTYYVTSSDTVTGCISVKDTANLTINFTPQPTASNVNVCFGNSAILTATGTNIQWYDSTLTLAFAGSSYNTGLTTVHTYTFYATQTLNGCESSMKLVTLTINPIPVVPTAPDKQSCFGQATPTLTATGTSIKWYNDATLLTLVHSGSPYNTGLTTAGTYTYYVTQTAVGCASPSDTVYLAIHALPSTPVATNTFVCLGNPTPDLVAAGITGNDTVHWYTNSSLTPVIYTGNPYATGQTTAGTYTYYVTQTDTVNGCRSKSDTVTLSINTSPLEPVANDPTICFGNLTPSLIASGTNLQWFDNPSLTPVVGVGPFTPTVTAVGTYTFFVTDSVPGCPQSPADTALLTINPIPAAPVSVPQKDSICFGQANPSFSAAGTNIEWWSNPSTATLISSGSPFTPTVTVTGTYSYYVTQSALSCKSPSDTVIFKINPVPVVNLGLDATQCGGTVTLNAGNVGATYLWSDNSTAQTLVVSASGTYSVLVTNAGGCTMTDTINITINPIPAAPISVPQKDSICFGQANPSFSATGTNIEWWSNPSTTTLISSGSPFIPTATAAGTYTYYVTQSSLGCKSPSDTATFIIHFTPKLAVNDTSVSFGSPAVNLSATGTNLQWYDTSSTMVNAGSPFNTGLTAIGSYTYFVTQTLFGCEGVKDTVIATILPGTPTSASQTVCFGQTVPDLTATGTNIKWYSNATLTTLVGTGSPFATGQTAAGTYTYYVTQTVNNAQSPDTMVTLTVNPLPATLTASNQNACVGGTIPDLTTAGINIQWYDTLDAMVYAGSSFATGQSAVGTYTYMVTQTNTVTGCESFKDTVTLTINALPVPPVACNDTAICFGYPIPNLSAAGTNITWYDGSGNFVTTGSLFPPAVSAPGIYTFIATQTNTLTTCESAGDTVKLTINSTAPPVAPDVAVCFGNPVPPLVAIGTNIQWYDASMTLVSTNDTLVTGQTAAGTYTYYVTQTNSVTTCPSQTDTVYLIISTQPVAAPIVADQTSCAGSAIADLTSSTGTIINWYSDAALTNHVFTGNPFATGQTTAGTYTFFAADSTPGCPHGPSDTAMLTINPQPATPVVHDTATCFGSTNPDLIFIGTNVQWYNTSFAVVFSGDTFTTGQTAAGTYTYYVTQTNTVTTCSSKADTVMFTIHTLPSVPVALDTTVCSSATIPNLTAGGTNVQWYDTAGAFVFTGNSYATGQTTSGTHMYYVTQTDAVTGCESVRDTATLVIILAPPVPVVNNVAMCSGNPVPSLTSNSTNGRWYSDAALTNLVHSGNSFNTGQTTVGVYTYYITDSLTGCISSAADSATLTINPIPAKPVANNVTVCYGSTSVMSTTGNNPQWYSDATLINKIGTGNNFSTGKTTVGIYTYYVTLSDSVTGCTSLEDTALLTINPTPLVTANTYSVTIMQNDSTTLTAYNAVTYLWSTGATTNSIIASPTLNTTYTVTGTNAYGCSNSVTIGVVVNPLSVATLNDPVQDVTIYPNPAIDRFTLEFNTSLESPIKIYLLNMLGEKISVIQDAGMQGTGLMQHKYSVSTGNLAEGVYQIQIVTEQGTVNRKVVLLR